MNTLLLGMPGGWEWIAILAVVILLFGMAKPPAPASAGFFCSSFCRHHQAYAYACSIYS